MLYAQLLLFITMMSDDCTLVLVIFNEMMIIYIFYEMIREVYSH